MESTRAQALLDSSNSVHGQATALGSRGAAADYTSPSKDKALKYYKKFLQSHAELAPASTCRETGNCYSTTSVQQVGCSKAAPARCSSSDTQTRGHEVDKSGSDSCSANAVHEAGQLAQRQTSCTAIAVHSRSIAAAVSIKPARSNPEEGVASNRGQILANKSITTSLYCLRSHTHSWSSLFTGVLLRLIPASVSFCMGLTSRNNLVSESSSFSGLPRATADIRGHETAVTCKSAAPAGTLEEFAAPAAVVVTVGAPAEPTSGSTHLTSTVLNSSTAPVAMVSAYDFIAAVVDIISRPAGWRSADRR